MDGDLAEFTCSMRVRIGKEWEKNIMGESYIWQSLASHYVNMESGMA
jgi:hypothetical protein